VDHKGQGQNLHSSSIWNTKEKQLLVEITEKKAKKHLELIELIAEQIKHTKVTKEQVLALRAKVVEHNGE
jgi:hypothetical protein